MFCIHCGANLPDNAKFCANCGNPVVRDAPQPPRDPGPAPGPGPNPPSPGKPFPQKSKPKWLIPMVVVGVVIGVAFSSFILWNGLNTFRNAISQPTTQESSLETDLPSSQTIPSDFIRYENESVCFSLSYPDSMELSEPNANNVLLGAEDQFRVAVEYAYMTVRDCFIYSAQDMAQQIETDPTVLADWVGAEGVTITGQFQSETSNSPYYGFLWELAQEEASYQGGLYIFDSQGEFGCYTFLWMADQDAPNLEEWEQTAAQMLESFTVTTPYQMEGYTIYEEVAEGVPVRFALQDAYMEGEINNWSDDGLLDIFPLAKEQRDTTSRIYITNCYLSTASADPEEDEFASSMESSVSFFFDNPQYPNAQITSQLSSLSLGRYPYMELDLCFNNKDGGVSWTETCYRLVFPRGDGYWQVNLAASEENLEQSTLVLVDLLRSLRFEEDSLELGEDAFGTLSEFRLEEIPGVAFAGATEGTSRTGSISPTDLEQIAELLLSQAESTPGFVPPNDYYEPLASLTDLDGNGLYEFLILYKLQDGVETNVVYDVYSIQANGYIPLLTAQPLYMEVGGNSGSINLTLDMAKGLYLVVKTQTPSGSDSVNTLQYVPWLSDQTGFREDVVYLESHINYEDESKNQYISGDTKVDQATFEARQTEFASMMTDLNLNLGPGNGGNNMSFAQIRDMDMATYGFYSVK